jgi:hypothetical protein
MKQLKAHIALSQMTRRHMLQPTIIRDISCLHDQQICCVYVANYYRYVFDVRCRRRTISATNVLHITVNYC